MPVNTTLANPFTKPNPLQKPLMSPKPTTTTVGNVSVNTNKPVLIKPEPAPTEPVKEETQGFWAKRTKTQKGLIIGGAIAIIIAVVVLRKKK